MVATASQSGSGANFSLDDPIPEDQCDRDFNHAGPKGRATLGEAIVAAKQTRRSISVRGTTYDNLRRYCEQQDTSMSEVVEEQLARLLAQESSTTSSSSSTSSAASSSGRPAPVAYDKVVAPRIARAPKGDYRTIRF